MQRKNTLAAALAAILFCLALLRAVAFWAHEPMLAYANNFDQIRAMYALRLQPVKPDMSEPYAGTPTQPWRYFSRGQAKRSFIYPSSDLLVKAAQIGITKLWRDMHDPLDIKHFSASLLAFWLAAMGWITWQMGRASRWHTVGFCAWLLLISDPVNLLYLNTLYAEFSAFVAFSIFIGACWLALALRRISNALMLAAFAALLVLATNRNQYMYLPLALSPLLLWGWRRRADIGVSKRLIALGSMICIAVPLLLYGAQPGQLKDTGRANRVNTVFATMLPAASNPANTLRQLNLPPSCLQFSSHSWYDTPTTQYTEHCPTIFQIPLHGLLPALLKDPEMLVRMTVRAADGHRGHFHGELQENRTGCFIPWFLGEVESMQNGHLHELRSPAAQSLDAALAELPRIIRRTIILMPLCLPALLALALAWRRRKAESLALLAVQILALYFFFSSLLGDGYADFERHAVLYYSIGCAAFLATVVLVFYSASIFLHKQTVCTESP